MMKSGWWITTIAVLLLCAFYYLQPESLTVVNPPSCVILSEKNIGAPDNKWHLSESVVSECGSQPQTISLLLEYPDLDGTFTKIIHVPAFQNQSRDQLPNPVVLQYRWLSSTQLEIWYPHGLEAYLYSGKDEKISLRDLSFTEGLFFGLQINLRENAL